MELAGTFEVGWQTRMARQLSTRSRGTETEPQAHHPVRLRPRRPPSSAIKLLACLLDGRDRPDDPAPLVLPSPPTVAVEPTAVLPSPSIW